MLTDVLVGEARSNVMLRYLVFNPSLRRGRPSAFIFHLLPGFVWALVFTVGVCVNGDRTTVFTALVDDGAHSSDVDH